MHLAVPDDKSVDNSSSSPEPRGSYECAMWKGLRFRISHSGQESTTVTSSESVPAINDDI